MEYGGLNAKIKALRGMLFTESDYEALSRLSGFDELRSRLAETVDYGKVMEGISGGSRRYKVEQNIYLTLSDELNRIYGFVGDYKIRRFLDSFYLNNEIRIIKILLCMIYDEREIDFSHVELMLLIGKTLKVDVNRIKNAKTLPEFVEARKDTRLYSVLSTFYSGASLFELETRLDLYYYTQIMRIKNRTLDGVNRKIAGKLVGAEVDMKNIIWIYRLKTYYKMADNTIYAYLIPYGHRLKRPQLGRLIEAKNQDELLSEIRCGPYARAFGEVSAGDGLERASERELMRLFNYYAVMYPNSIAVTISYLFKKEQEIKNVISLIEGMRYKLDSREILRHLVL